MVSITWKDLGMDTVRWCLCTEDSKESERALAGGAPGAVSLGHALTGENCSSQTTTKT